MGGRNGVLDHDVKGRERGLRTTGYFLNLYLT